MGREMHSVAEMLAGITGEERVLRERSYLAIEPRTSEEVSRILQVANETGTPVIPRGGGTGWWSKSQSRAGRIVLEMTGMTRVLAIDADTMTVTAEAGISFAKLESAISEKGYRLVIFPESGRTATVGGHIETWGTSPYASSGFEDQATQIVSLKVVLPTGEIVQTGSGAVRGAAGNFARRFFPADLTGLFIGAEGALGVITEATLKMHGWPEAITTRIIGFRELGGPVRVLREYQETQRRGGLLTIVEQRLMQRHMLVAAIPRMGKRVAEDLIYFLSIRGDGDAEDVGRHVMRACEIAERQGGTVLDDEVPEWWEGRYKLISDALRGPRIMVVAMVPMGRFLEAADLIERAGKDYRLAIPMLAYPISGPIMLVHAILPVAGPDPQERRKALSSARRLMEKLMNIGAVPHRVGTDFLPVIRKRLDPSYYELVERVKKLLDPNGIMNPGLVIPS